MMISQGEAFGAVVKKDRPVGIWILAVLNIILAGIWFSPVLRVLQNYSSDMWPQRSLVAAPFNVCLFVVTCIAILGTWAGSRVARTVFIASLFLLAAFEVEENFYVVSMWFSKVGENPELYKSLPVLWGVSAGLRWVLWFGFNAWYFYGPITTVFYRKPT